MRLPLRVNPRWYRALALLGILAGLTSVYSASASVVLVDWNGVQRAVRSHAGSVAAALREAGIGIASEDEVFPALDAPLVPGMVIRVRTAANIILADGRELAGILSPAARPADVLADAGVRLYPGDRVWVDGVPIPDPSAEVGSATRIRREASLQLVANVRGRVLRLFSAAPTVGEALWEAGVDVRVGDALSRPYGASLRSSSAMEIASGWPVTIEVDGALRRGWSGGISVAEALAASGVGLVGQDYAIPGPAERVPPDGRIRVVRVTEGLQTVLEPIPFETTYEPDPETEIDHQTLIDPGSYGVAAELTRIRWEDGVEVVRVEEGRRVVRDPEPRVVGYGTGITVRALDTPDGPIQYWRAVSMYATAYSPCNLGVPNYCSDITSSGKVLERGMVAFILRWYRVMKGQALYIPGYGFATVEDVGGGIPGRYWIDLGYSDSDIVSWNRWVTVYFLAPVPSPDRILWVLD